MRSLTRFIVLILLTIATTGAFAAWSILPEPPVVRAVAPSPEQVIQQMRIEQAVVEARAVYARNHASTQFVLETATVAIEHRVPVRIVAAIVIIESSVNPNLCTRDCGLMQINRHVWHYSKKELLDPQRNLQLGTQILASYIHRYGLIGGLWHYNGLGSKECPTDRMMYAGRVLRAAGGFRS